MEGKRVLLVDTDPQASLTVSLGNPYKEISNLLHNTKNYALQTLCGEPHKIWNEEGKLNGSELNRALRDEDGDIYDIVDGDFYVVGLGEEDFCSLSPEQMKKYEEHFHQPEMFVRMGRSIMALPLPEDKVKKADAPEKAAPTPHKSSPDRDSL